MKKLDIKLSSKKIIRKIEKINQPSRLKDLVRGNGFEKPGLKKIIKKDEDQEK